MKSATLMFAAFLWMIAATLHAEESIAEKISTEDRAFFEKEVRPLLVKRCFECHGGSEAEGGLSLASAEGWRHGGDSGPAIVPGKPEESFLIEAVNYESWEMPPADRRTLLRRLSYGLTGLPPTAKEVEAFIADESSDAYSRVIERLLDSPQYGVHWGRRWLDVVRYADTAGDNSDYPLPHAWRYRNWVMVNRIWQWHFGAALVRTPNDFGARGDAPTHPELLEFLTARFVQSGYSVKAMHRLILETNAYQRASATHVEAEPDDEMRLQAIYRNLFQRLPTPAEQERAAKFLRSYPGETNDTWSAIARILLASNEFLHVD